MKREYEEKGVIGENLDCDNLINHLSWQITRVAGRGTCTGTCMHPHIGPSLLIRHLPEA